MTGEVTFNNTVVDPKELQQQRGEDRALRARGNNDTATSMQPPRLAQRTDSGAVTQPATTNGPTGTTGRSLVRGAQR